jgi:hypothetical protein
MPGTPGGKGRRNFSFPSPLLQKPGKLEVRKSSEKE